LTQLWNRLAPKIALLVLSALPATAAHAADLTVFAAASLKEALDSQVARFASDTGIHASVAYAASSALARQIAAGAPADVFISADGDWIEYLEAQKLLRPGTRVSLLRNRLVLIAPVASRIALRIAPSFPLAAALAGGRLAMANPDAVPAGRYGRDALRSLGVWTSVEQHTARTENVRVALLLVSRGEAPLGIVYATDALADAGVRVVDIFPEDTHAPIVYPVAIVASSHSHYAQGFLDSLVSPAARTIWTQHGFAMAD
jgi:molybdate transport system substrate-binding protein